MSDDREFSLGGKGNSCNVIDNDRRRPSNRNAAAKAHERISEQLRSEATYVMFTFPGECHGDELINNH